jgi:CelD/BcsL family acetyltransferase involved in cellulose biosynthesis
LEIYVWSDSQIENLLKKKKKKKKKQKRRRRERRKKGSLVGLQRLNLRSTQQEEVLHRLGGEKKNREEKQEKRKGKIGDRQDSIPG